MDSSGAEAAGALLTVGPAAGAVSIARVPTELPPGPATPACTMSTVWSIEGRAEYTPLGAEEEGDDGVGQHSTPVVVGSAQEGAAAEIARLRATVVDLEAETSKHDEEVRRALGERDALQKQLASREGSGAGSNGFRCRVRRVVPRVHPPHDEHPRRASGGGY